MNDSTSAELTGLDEDELTEWREEGMDAMEGTVYE